MIFVLTQTYFLTHRIRHSDVRRSVDQAKSGPLKATQKNIDENRKNIEIIFDDPATKKAVDSALKLHAEVSTDKSTRIANDFPEIYRTAKSRMDNALASIRRKFFDTKTRVILVNTEMQGQVRKPGRNWYVQFRWEPKNRSWDKKDNIKGWDDPEDPEDIIQQDLLTKMAKTVYFECDTVFDVSKKDEILDKIKDLLKNTQAYIDSFEFEEENCEIVFRSNKQATNAFKALKMSKDPMIVSLGRMRLPNFNI